jgi:pimeloyl-ACP methyl ester carboxylesterase
MNQSNQINLRDGRTLGYAEYGCADGFPILFFHGLPGSRLEANKLHDAALKTKVRLIGLDRPGMGLSSPQKNRTILAWAEDVDAASAALNLETFSIIGHSGGAPYVAACAFRIPEKIHKAVIVSGIAPLTYPEAVTCLTKSQKLMYWMLQYCPFLLNWMMRLSAKTLENPKRLKIMIKQLPEIDQKIFENPHYNEMMLLSLKEAFRQKVTGVIDDFKLVSNPLGFDLEKIQCPFVIWQGGQDQQAPVKHAEIYEKHIPQANYMFLKEEGHISILHHYDEQILTSAL